MTQRHAIVVGAGIAGLSTAIGLRRHGWEVTVVERAAELREVGAGISLWSNALRALDLLGLGDRVRELGAVEAGAGFREDSGRWLLRTNLTELEERYGPTILIRRPVLLDILRSALQDDVMRLGREVRRAEADDRRVAVTVLRDGAEEERFEADVLVGADGIRSLVRRTFWPDAAPPVYAGYTTWRFMTPPLGLHAGVTESWGRGERVGIFPFPDGAIYSYLGASVPPGTAFADEWAELRRRFGRWHDPIPTVIDSASGGELLRHDIYRLPPLDSYVRQRVALVGDAAHAMTPDFGQGGCTGLEDAVELAAALDATPSLHGALQDYDRHRRPRTRTIARQSALFGRIAQWSAPPAVALRNTVLRLLPPSVMLRSLRPILSWPESEDRTTDRFNPDRVG